MLELHASFRIETGGGLVHDQDLRVVKQRAAETEALGHAFGKLIGKSLCQRHEVGEVHDFLDALAAFFALVAKRGRRNQDTPAPSCARSFRSGRASSR